MTQAGCSRVSFGTFHSVFFLILKLAYRYQAANIVRKEQRIQFVRGLLEHCDLEVEDEGIYRDVDTREEYRELVEWNYKRGGGHPITPLVQVRLKAGDVFFGPGTGQLLDMIHQTGSIQEACCRIGLSYSKGSRMIREVERQLGIPVVERRTGGMGGGGSSLTDEGKKLMDSYARMVAEVRQSTEQIFLKYFGKGISS